MSAADYQILIADAVRRLKDGAADIALRMAQTGLSLVKERSIRDGISVDGAYADYSTKEVYKSSFKKKELNASGKKYASSGGKGTWGEFRVAQGRSGANVNGFYSGRMWTSLRTISQSQNGYVYSVLVGQTDQDAARVMAGMLKRYGNFLKFTDAERQLLNDDAADEARKLIGL